MLAWLLCGVLAVAVAVLGCRLRVMQRSLDEIGACLTAHLTSDTNAEITVSSGDRHVRRLAAQISRELATLRRRRRRYENGDRELKEAVTNISHDLRTPLTAICGYLELLEREDKSEAATRYLGQITERTEALRKLTEELMRYSVITSVPELTMEDMDLRCVLEESLLSFAGLLGQTGIPPRITLPDRPVRRRLDRLSLSRIFENILSNAVRHGGGALSVTLGEDGVLVFANPAPALSSVEVGKLFDRFYTVDPTRRSTGLGLSIARLLTERMGGRIGASYTDGILAVTVAFDQEAGAGACPPHGRGIL